MRFDRISLGTAKFMALAAGLALGALNVPATSWAVDLFTEDFEVDPTANWTVNLSGVADSDEAANFFFDYKTVGIPLAPNSEPGGTRGLNLQANRDSDSDGLGAFSGFSVSPNGQDFSTAGDYKLTFDWWPNFPGPFPAGSSGTSQLSTFGIGTSGTFSNWPGNADGIYFAATLDGGSSADYRVYSQERVVSYQTPADTGYNPDLLDNVGEPIDHHATYHAGSRNNTAALYMDNFGNVEAPAAQVALFPQQTGATAAGSVGMEWHEVEIAKIGDLVTWKVDGVLLITLDTTNFVTPVAGGNIMFGQSDINATVSMDPERLNLLFTLIDNVKVSTIDEPPAVNPDFNGNRIVDAADYVVWRKNAGLMGTGTQATGDANGDMNVNQADYDLWRAAFGASLPAAAGAAVPEPGSLGLCLIAAIGVVATARRHRPRGRD
jgi:hypothetical protein